MQTVLCRTPQHDAADSPSCGTHNGPEAPSRCSVRIILSALPHRVGPISSHRWGRTLLVKSRRQAEWEAFRLVKRLPLSEREELKKYKPHDDRSASAPVSRLLLPSPPVKTLKTRPCRSTDIGPTHVVKSTRLWVKPSFICNQEVLSPECPETKTTHLNSPSPSAIW